METIIIEKKANKKIDLELLEKVKRSLEDIKHGRVKRWKNN